MNLVCAKLCLKACFLGQFSLKLHITALRQKLVAIFFFLLSSNVFSGVYFCINHSLRCCPIPEGINLNIQKTVGACIKV